MRQHYPTVIIGGGTFGTAAAWALARRGERALVLEQFQHVHSLGSHSGQTRVIRHAYAEGGDYVPLVLKADRLWQELEREAGEQMLIRTGSIELDAGETGHASRAGLAASQHNLPYETLGPREVRKRWPSIRMPEDWSAGFDPNAGFLKVESALRSMAALAEQGDVSFCTMTAATGWGATAGGAWVDTSDGRLTCDRLIVTGGAWMPGLMQELKLPVRIYRKLLFWLAVNDVTRFRPERMPVVLTDSDLGEIYSFPITGDEGFKIARHDGGAETSPATVDRTVRIGEESEVVPLAMSLFEGVCDRVVSAAVCLYERTPDSHFIIDRHPAYPHVILAAGFSGHGFKFAPVIGEMLVDLALDNSQKPLPLFRLDRFESPS